MSKIDSEKCELHVVLENCPTCEHGGCAFLVAKYGNGNIVPLVQLPRDEQRPEVTPYVEYMMKARMVMPDSTPDEVLRAHASGVLDHLMKIFNEEKDGE